MPRKPYKIPELEVRYGDLEKIIPALVNTIGQAQTAEKLEVSQSTISRWLSENGYTATTQYTKKQGAINGILESR